MNISKFLEKEVVRLDGELNGEAYWIEAEASSLTPTVRNAFIKSDMEPLELVKVLAKHIKNWNWYVKEEGDLKPSFEVIANLPDEMISSLANTFSQAWNGDSKKQKATSSGS